MTRTLTFLQKETKKKWREDHLKKGFHNTYMNMSATMFMQRWSNIRNEPTLSYYIERDHLNPMALWLNRSSSDTQRMTLDHKVGALLHLYPGVPVVSGGGPGIHQALAVEAGQLGAPALQAQQPIVDRGGGDLRLSDSPSLHAQQGHTAWGRAGEDSGAVAGFTRT